MKRIIALLLVCAFVCVAFVGCSNTGKCESCGKEDVELSSVTIEGETRDVCEDCEKLVEGLAALGEALEDAQ